MKRMISLVVSLVMILSLSVSTVWAEEPEAESVTIRISDGTTVHSYDVQSYQSELFFPAELFGEITDYQFTSGEKKCAYTLGVKRIAIDLSSGEMSIPALNYTGTVGEVLQKDGIYYLSAASLLPWLNVACSVDENGALEVVPDGISIWEILDEVTYDKYMFNLYAEYGDSVSSIAGLTAMSVFDTIINLRWERLIPADKTITGAAKGASYYDYKNYVSSFASFATDDALSSAAAEKKVDSVIKVNKGLDDLEEKLGIDEDKLQYDIDYYLRSAGADADTVTFYYDITESWQTLRRSVSSYGKISKYMNVFSILKAYELAIGTDGEYREYISWLADRDTGNTVMNSALDEAVTKLDENGGFLISVYLDLGRDVLRTFPDHALEAIVNNSLDEDLISAYSAYKSGFFKSLGKYMLAAKVVYGNVLGVTKGFEGMSKATVNESIGDYCWTLSRELQKETMTSENVAHIRQSLMTALKASKACYQAMQDVMGAHFFEWISGTDNSSLMDYKLDPINERLVELVASADNTENDSIEGKDAFRDSLLEMEAGLAQTKKIGEEELRFIRTVLSAIGGVEFKNSSDLSSETVARIVMAFPDISYVYYNTDDYIPYTITEDYGCFISDNDLATASSAMFGAAVTCDQIQALSNYAGYEISTSGCTRMTYNGRGRAAEVVIDEIRYEGDAIEASYRYLTYDNPEAADSRTPSTTTLYVAYLHRNDSNAKYPFRIDSNTLQDNNTSERQFAVCKAFEQLVQWGMDFDGGYAVLNKCSLLQDDPYALSDYYAPDSIWAYYVEDLDSDGDPELALISGEVDNALYVLDYRGNATFSISLIEGFDLRLYNGRFFVENTYGDYYEDEPYDAEAWFFANLKEIDKDTLYGKKASAQGSEDEYSKIEHSQINGSIQQIVSDISNFYD